MSATSSDHQPRVYVVTAAMTEDDRGADLLAAASVLHRRGVHVVEADLGRPSDGRRVFSATIVVTPARARTVLCTLENLVGVLDAALFETLDARSPARRIDELVPATRG